MLGPAAGDLSPHRRRLARGTRWRHARLRRILVDRRDRPHGSPAPAGPRTGGCSMSESSPQAIREGISREIVFTDYAVREDDRHTVTIASRLDGTPAARVNLNWRDLEQTEPDMLRSLAACLLAAADEMERMRP